MKIKNFCILAAVFSCLSGTAWSAEKSAEGGLWKPSSPVTVIVPYGAGGGQDVRARIFVKYAEKYAGQKFVVEDRPGGSGAIGNTAIANARPNGRTLGMFHNLSLYDQYIVPGVTYTEKSFIPLAFFTSDSNVIVVSRKLGVTDLQGLIEKAKESPGKITWCGPEFSSQTYPRMNVENAAGVKFARMIFDGGAKSLVAVASGDCGVTTVFASEYAPFADNADVVKIASCGTERLSALPDVPTMIEQGVNATFAQWGYIVAPAGTPDDIIKGYQSIFQKALDDPDCIKELQAAGFETVNIGGPEAISFALKLLNENKDAIIATVKQANP
jgi:tripartite-type tricarboxylate transporter receptor subunit TctC